MIKMQVRISPTLQGALKSRILFRFIAILFDFNCNEYQNNFRNAVLSSAISIINITTEYF